MVYHQFCYPITLDIVYQIARKMLTIQFYLMLPCFLFFLHTLSRFLDSDFNISSPISWLSTEQDSQQKCLFTAWRNRWKIWKRLFCRNLSFQTITTPPFKNIPIDYFDKENLILEVLLNFPKFWVQNSQPRPSEGSVTSICGVFIYSTK